MFGAKRLYVTGQLTYSLGAAAMAMFPSLPSVFLFSPTAGVMYGTLFTMPYILIANYHSQGVFEEEEREEALQDEEEEEEVEMRNRNRRSRKKRGLGTDVALVSSMVFLAQFLLSFIVGALVHLTGTTRVVMVIASLCATAGAYTATKVTYLDL